MRVLNARRAVYRCTNRPAAAVGDRKQSVRHQASEACTSMSKAQASMHGMSKQQKPVLGGRKARNRQHSAGRATTRISHGRFRFRGGHHELSWAESSKQSTGMGRKACCVGGRAWEEGPAGRILQQGTRGSVRSCQSFKKGRFRARQATATGLAAAEGHVRAGQVVLRHGRPRQAAQGALRPPVAA